MKSGNFWVVVDAHFVLLRPHQCRLVENTWWEVGNIRNKLQMVKDYNTPV